MQDYLLLGQVGELLLALDLLQVLFILFESISEQGLLFNLSGSQKLDRPHGFIVLVSATLRQQNTRITEGTQHLVRGVLLEWSRVTLQIAALKVFALHYTNKVLLALQLILLWRYLPIEATVPQILDQ